MVIVSSEEEALEIARRRAEEKDWSLEEPIEVRMHRAWFSKAPTVFKIETNVGYFGAKAHFTIDAKTGEIKEEGYIDL
jgi:uncharacterized membrane protein YkoI